LLVARTQSVLFPKLNLFIFQGKTTRNHEQKPGQIYSMQPFDKLRAGWQQADGSRKRAEYIENVGGWRSGPAGLKVVGKKSLGTRN
jgi:hypothetical protein